MTVMLSILAVLCFLLALPGIARRRPQHGPQAGRMLCILSVVGLAALPAPLHAQWRVGDEARPAPALDSRAGKLAGYAEMVDTWQGRLREAVDSVASKPPPDPQDGALPQQRAHLLDVAQSAWMAIRNVPADFDDSSAYEAAVRQFEISIGEMREVKTPTPQALAEGRKILGALQRLETAAREAARKASP